MRSQPCQCPLSPLQIRTTELTSAPRSGLHRHDDHIVRAATWERGGTPVSLAAAAEKVPGTEVAVELLRPLLPLDPYSSDPASEPFRQLWQTQPGSVHVLTAQVGPQCGHRSSVHWLHAQLDADCVL